jgi:phosphoenolpyruvate-protein phosphotransferase
MNSASMLRVRGVPVVPGIAFGPVEVVGYVTRARGRMPVPDVAVERKRLARAIETSFEGLSTLREHVDGRQGEDAASLLDPLLLLHRDPLVVGRAQELVRELGLSAEDAVIRAVRDACAALADMPSSYLRERVLDVEHVGRHLLRTLEGENVRSLPRGPAILAANDLSPADAAALFGSEVLGIVLQSGSATCHTALMARSLGIPTVVGARLLPLSLLLGEEAILDGFRGEIVIGPDAGSREEAAVRAERHRSFHVALRSPRDAPVVTSDGEPVVISANVELPVEAKVASAAGLGIGLFRSEYLAIGRRDLPSEEEQHGHYLSIIEALGGRPFVLRTFDFAGDKGRPGEEDGRSLRGLRRGSFLDHETLLPQLRAALRASVSGPLAVMFPRIARLEELEAGKALVARARESLAEDGITVGDVPVGMMVEVPAAAMLAHRFARACDFLSVGTNDLTQFTLAIDRDETTHSLVSSTMEPAVLSLLDRTAHAAEEARIELSMCGELACDVVGLPLVIGLGYRRLSVPIAEAPIVAEVVRRIDTRIARLLVQDALALGSAADVKALVIERFGGVLNELWLEEGRTDEPIA